MPQGSAYLPLGKMPDESLANPARTLKKVFNERDMEESFAVPEGGSMTAGEMKAYFGALLSRDPAKAARLLEQMGVTPEEFVAMILEREESEGLTFDVDETKLSTAMETIKEPESSANKLGQALAVQDEGVEAPVTPPGGEILVAQAGPGEPAKVTEVPKDDPRVDAYRKLMETQNGLTGEALEQATEAYRLKLPVESGAISLPSSESSIEEQLETYRQEMIQKGYEGQALEQAVETQRQKLLGAAKPAPEPTPEAIPEETTPTPVPPPSGTLPVDTSPQPGLSARPIGAAPTAPAAGSTPSAAPVDTSQQLRVLSEALSGLEGVGEPTFNAVSTPSAPGGASGIDQNLLRQILQQSSGQAAPLTLGKALALGR